QPSTAPSFSLPPSTASSASASPIKPERIETFKAGGFHVDGGGGGEEMEEGTDGMDRIMDGASSGGGGEEDGEVDLLFGTILTSVLGVDICEPKKGVGSGAVQLVRES